MNICILCHTKYANGRQCVEGLAAALSALGHAVEVVPVGKADPKELPLADMYIFSSPTEHMDVTWKMKRFLMKIAPLYRGVRYAAMTVAAEEDDGKAGLRRMEDILIGKGFTRIAQGLVMRVEKARGELEWGWEKKLELFARSFFVSPPEAER